MNGTSGIRPKTAHATFAPAPMSDLVARSIHMRMTASGWNRQTISSRSFFTSPESTRRPAGQPRGLERGRGAQAEAAASAASRVRKERRFTGKYPAQKGAVYGGRKRRRGRSDRSSGGYWGSSPRVSTVERVREHGQPRRAGGHDRGRGGRHGVRRG